MAWDIVSDGCILGWRHQRCSKPDRAQCLSMGPAAGIPDGAFTVFHNPVVSWTAAEGSNDDFSKKLVCELNPMEYKTLDQLAAFEKHSSGICVKAGKPVSCDLDGVKFSNNYNQLMSTFCGQLSTEGKCRTLNGEMDGKCSILNKITPEGAKCQLWWNSSKLTSDVKDAFINNLCNDPTIPECKCAFARSFPSVQELSATGIPVQCFFTPCQDNVNQLLPSNMKILPGTCPQNVCSQVLSIGESGRDSFIKENSSYICCNNEGGCPGGGGGTGGGGETGGGGGGSGGGTGGGDGGGSGVGLPVYEYVLIAVGVLGLIAIIGAIVYVVSR